ncbi:MAG: hypothetical protein CL666_07855 [Balneola sp.]|nr:hypothetical protein [Balneola sp.]
MIKKIRDIYYDELDHEHRIMLCLICAELFLIGVVRLWPEQPQPNREYEDTFTDEVTYVENAIITKQTTAPAAPPKPIVPVPVPNDEIIEEEIDFPEFDEIFTRYDATGEQGTAETEGEGEIVGSPQQPAGLVRIVEPTIPSAAKRADVKALIEVTFLVGTNGNVEDFFISEIRVYDGATYETVNEIGFGLMQAVTEAASKWRFSPARDDGKPVRTYVVNTFRIGF